MSTPPTPPVGTLAWTDLTVKDAEAVIAFYKAVVGWQSSPVNMGDYDDYAMLPPDSKHAAVGICHARGANADLPPQWLIYVIVADLNESLARCVELGGKILIGPKSMGEKTRYCVIQDPAGAIMALYAPGG